MRCRPPYQASAAATTWAGIGAPDALTTASDASCHFGDGYFAAAASLPVAFQLAQVGTSSGAAVNFDGVDKASLFVRAQASADALSSQLATHGENTGWSPDVRAIRARLAPVHELRPLTIELR